MIIESPQNKLIKHAASLKVKKFRDEYGEFLAEGLRSVVDIIKSAANSVICIFFANNQADKLAAELGKAIFADLCLGEKLIELPDTLMRKLSDTTTSQEIIAVVKQKPESNVGDFCLYLDRIRDPGNLGTIIRTAAAAGYSLILDGCTDIFSPKVVRSSMSAIMSVDFCYAENRNISAFKDDGYIVLAADMNGENMYSFKRANKVCIVIGNEANGISPQIFEKCDNTVSIPVNGVESLNAAVSAAILMYHFKFGV